MLPPTLANDSGRIARQAKLQIDPAQLEKTSKPPLARFARIANDLKRE